MLVTMLRLVRRRRRRRRVIDIDAVYVCVFRYMRKSINEYEMMMIDDD